MSFEYPWLLLLLLLAIPVWLLFLRTNRLRHERLNRFAESGLLGRLLDGESQRLRNIRFVLVFGGVLVVLFCASGPRISGGKETVQLTGVDIVLVVDVSNSMLATDLQPNRIERTKLELNRLIQQSEADRFGVVIFAGRAIPQLPLTTDKGSALQVIEALSTRDISRQGTNIAEALELAARSFTDDSRGRAIILISDGEAHEGETVDVVKELAKKKIIVSAVGVGSTSGTKLPEIGADGRITGDKRDENGQIVISKLNESLLQDIARAGSGIYVKAGTTDFGLKRIYSSLQSLSKTPSYMERFTSYRTLVPWLLIGALLLFAIEVVLPEGRRKPTN